ncbi:unnamed protein product [Musa acuminata subsp. malaccensis]|uniref:(wild Malaysian banana) hypothetical protein n=1 Tax=Musa acuminata subsp. malaccensis TaxID=214687 RepID=A0A804J9V0_MUSAM|nr:unnamed protein product [Musa acuminata subsp. malaccensis]
MVYTAADTFYVTDERSKNPPSSKDGIDEETETMPRLYNCGSPSFFSFVSSLTIKTTGQVLLHWFYCKKSFARFSVKQSFYVYVYFIDKLDFC